MGQGAILRLPDHSQVHPNDEPVCASIPTTGLLTNNGTAITFCNLCIENAHGGNHSLEPRSQLTFTEVVDNAKPIPGLSKTLRHIK